MRRLAAIACVAVTACGPAGGPDLETVTGRKVKGVATIGMIGDVARNIGGDNVDVETLMGPGIDPHVYKASEGDVISIGESDVVFYNGLHLEAAMADVLAQTTRVRTVALGEYVDESKLLTPPEFEGQYDPHVWFDVLMWIEVAEGIVEALADVNPENAEVYERNAAAYISDLRALHRYVADKAELVPPEKRVLITAHDAFNYFGNQYGFEVKGLQGISTATEAGSGDVQELADFIAERRIPAIFVESSVPRRTVEAVQAAVESRGFNVEIGGELFSDAMGDEGTEEGTYIGMVKHNIDTIVGALVA